MTKLNNDTFGCINVANANVFNVFLDNVHRPPICLCVAGLLRLGLEYLKENSLCYSIAGALINIGQTWMFVTLVVLWWFFTQYGFLCFLRPLLSFFLSFSPCLSVCLSVSVSPHHLFRAGLILDPNTHFP